MKAVKKPWRRSSRFNALSQILLTNQRLDNLAAITVEFHARGMLSHSAWDGYMDPAPPAIQPPQTTDNGRDDGDDGEAIDDRNIIGEMRLAARPSKCFPHVFSYSLCLLCINLKFVIFHVN